MTKYPATPATNLLDSLGVEYTKHLYDYNKSGAVAAADIMQVNEHAMIKTLVMEDGDHNPFIILMHGEKETSLKDLARELNTKNVKTVSIKDAQRYTGYMVGGISPFGTRRELKVHVERTILDLPYIYINGGRRGFILGMKPETLVQVLDPTPVNVAR
ncbi:MAG: Cys-tRNA(Pro) deacylase [Candidatus Bathyarchaeota archaeon]|nr:Cys-tRNA(Pro) deacylase [Candidatus Bathyarchaeota archaeon]